MKYICTCICVYVYMKYIYIYMIYIYENVPSMQWILGSILKRNVSLENKKFSPEFLKKINLHD